MNINQLKKRANNECELCKNSEDLRAFTVEPRDEQILICKICEDGLTNPMKNPNHFRVLSESMWSEVGAVQVVAYRTLHELKSEDFAIDLLDMIYLEDDIKKWADEGIKNEEISQTKDSNGVTLSNGDNVNIIKDLDVKGAGFTAKRGTIVKNISLTDNPEQIEGRVNGVRIVLLSKFLKKI